MVAFRLPSFVPVADSSWAKRLTRDDFVVCLKDQGHTPKLHRHFHFSTFPPGAQLSYPGELGGGAGEGMHKSGVEVIWR